jgi:hypothetical protein
MIALANALFLQGKIQLPTRTSTITYNQLTELLLEVLFASAETVGEERVAICLEVQCPLHAKELVTQSHVPSPSSQSSIPTTIKPNLLP